MICKICEQFTFKHYNGICDGCYEDKLRHQQIDNYRLERDNKRPKDNFIRLSEISVLYNNRKII